MRWSRHECAAPIDPWPPTAVLTAPSAAAPTSVAELAERFASAGATVVDVDELVAAIEATGVSDRQAQLRYGAPSVFALGEAVLAHLWATRGRPAPRPRPDAEPFLRASLARAALFLTPAAAAAAVQAPLARVAWPLLAATLVVGWAGAQALAYVAYAKASRGTPAGALRFLGTGFLALAALWCAAVALVPPDLVGHRSTAYLVCLAELGMFAGTAAALVGGTAPAGAALVGAGVADRLRVGAVRCGPRRSPARRRRAGGRAGVRSRPSGATRSGRGTPGRSRSCRRSVTSSSAPGRRRRSCWCGGSHRPTVRGCRRPPYRC